MIAAPVFKVKEASLYEQIKEQPIANMTITTKNDIMPYESSEYYQIQNNMVHTAYPFPRYEIRNIIHANTAIRLPIDVLSREVLLFGAEVKKKWEYKCENEKCGHEYKERPTDGSELDVCEYCGSNKIKTPDPEQYGEAYQFLTQDWNDNGQKLNDVLFELEQYSDAYDDAYLYLSTKYIYNKAGNIIKTIQENIVTIDVGLAHKIRDFMGRIGRGVDDSYCYVCTKHRNKFIWAKPDEVGDPEKPNKIRCPTCNKECIPAVLYTTKTGIYSDYTNLIIFGRDEVIMSHGKYNKSRVDGFPIVYTAYNMLTALYGAEKFFSKFFRNDRPPKAMLFIGTRNVDQLEEQIKKRRQIMRDDPNDVPIVMTPVDPGTRRIVEYVNMTGSLQELELAEQQKTNRTLIAALFGVMPIYEGGESQTTASDALAMAVSNRATYRNQRFLEETFLDEILTRRGVTDWCIKLSSVEITDEIRETQLATQKAELAQRMTDMGYKHHMDGDGNWVFDSVPSEPPQQTNNTNPDTPEEPSYMPRDDTNNPTGMRERKETSDVGGHTTGYPGSGDKTSHDR